MSARVQMREPRFVMFVRPMPSGWFTLTRRDSRIGSESRWVLASSMARLVRQLQRLDSGLGLVGRPIERGTNTMRLNFRIGMLCALMGLAQTARAQTITTFDVPGAVGTYPVAIGAFGRVTGSYVDINQVRHGFVRNAAGAITSFDAPAAGSSNGLGTGVSASNFLGEIVGSALNVTDRYVSRSFIRSPNGRFTQFDGAPGAIYTDAEAINLQGWVAGTYADAGYDTHGFVRFAHGAITTFDVPGFIGVINQIEPGGEVVGSYIESNGFGHGFVHKLDGTLTAFEAPGATRDVDGIGCGKCSGTLTTAANAAGRIVGYFGDASGAIHGFLRERTGKIAVLDVPASSATFPLAINLEGDIAGRYKDATGSVRGFLRAKDGSVESFDVPGLIYGNLIVTGLAPEGDVLGYYQDASAAYRGFVRKPKPRCEPR